MIDLPIGRIWMPTGIDAGTLGSPSSKDDVIHMVRSGDGWTTEGGTTITVYNCSTTPVVGARSGRAVRRNDGTYELFMADL